MVIKNTHFNFTEKSLNALPIPEKSSTYYDNGSEAGLCVICTYGGAKTYYAYMKYQGSPRRIKIGRVGQIKLTQARQKALELKLKSLNDEDPAQERQDTLRDMTLKQFYETQYFPRHTTSLKANSKRSEHLFFYNHLSCFHNRKMISITKFDIEKLRDDLKQDGKLHTANRVITLISSIYARALEWGYPTRYGNPALGISKFTEKSRDRFLHPEEIERFWKALEENPNEIFKKYIKLSLFIGQRKNNILSMKWSDIDFDMGFVYFADTKNGESQQIPLTLQAISLLKEMKENKTSDFVFPSETSASGHYEEPKRAWKTLLKTAKIENLRLHDLRRTQGSYQAITEASLNIIGKSLGHKSISSTQIYSRLTADPIRESMQKATDKMLDFIKKDE